MLRKFHEGNLFQQFLSRHICFGVEEKFFIIWVGLFCSTQNTLIEDYQHRQVNDNTVNFESHSTLAKMCLLQRWGWLSWIPS